MTVTRAPRSLGALCVIVLTGWITHGRPVAPRAATHGSSPQATRGTVVERPRSAPLDTALIARDGQHDFDFAFGTWTTHVSRLLHPLTASTTWVQYEGTSVVHKVWNGHANLVELEVDGAAGHLELASLRLYNPTSHQWSLNTTSRSSGEMTRTPGVGEFMNGRGVFYDQEDINGRIVLVRFVITELSPDSIRFEQAFSGDYGKSWEPNWIATDTRAGEGATGAP